ncbi:MAG TPA: hypothetical protein VGX68_08755 [Thermoanaerobaculia bacterium]|nr:hypothetical protein [Thermoanaerobaculia bacterium]
MPAADFEDSPQVAASVQRWLEHLGAVLFPGIMEDQIEEMMRPVSRDSAWLAHGGSGRRSRFYLVDEPVQVRFDFDGQGVLTSYAVHPRREPWRKAPDGTLLQGGDAPDVPIHFVGKD